MRRVAGAALLLYAVLLCVACDRSPADLVRRGNEFFAAGKFDEAELNYRKALQASPQLAEGHYRLGLADLKLGKLAAAYAELQRASELAPNYESDLIALCELDLSVYNSDPKHPVRFYEQASNVTDRLLRMNPDGFDGQRFKGALLIIDKKPGQAVEYFRRANRIRPDDSETALGLAQALIENHQEREGVELVSALIRKHREAGHAYDFLFRYYGSVGNLPAAEDILRLKVANNPTDPDFALQLARHYASVSKPELMVSTIAALLARPANPSDIHLRVGDFYGSVNLPEAALLQYKEGLQANSKQEAVYREKIARVLASQGKWADAYSQIDAHLRERPDDAAAKRIRASMWLEENRASNLDAAISEFRAQIAHNPDDAQLHFELGTGLARKGDKEGARREWTLAARPHGYLEPRFALAELDRDNNKPEDALRYSGEILDIAPGDLRARLLYASCLTSAGRFEEARNELRRLIADAPQFTPARYQLGLLAMEEKKYPEAEAIFRQLQTASPETAAIGLAALYGRQNRTQDAIRLLRDELARSPGSAQLQSLLAGTAAVEGDYDLAIDSYKKLDAESPGSSNWKLALAKAYFAKQDFGSAIALLNQALRTDPKSIPAALLLAEALQRNGATSDAIAAYRRVLAAAPINLTALNDLAFLLTDSGGSLDEALTLAQRGLESGTGERETRTNLKDTVGWIYLHQKKYELAIENFQSAAADSPLNPVYPYHLGMALLAKGDKRGARAALSEALAAKPDPADGAKIRELMAKL